MVNSKKDMDDNFVMKCPRCGGDVLESLPYTEDNKFFGKISIDLPDENCSQCGASFMTYQLSQALNAEYQKRIRNFLLTKHHPAQCRDEYYTAEEATRILGEPKILDAITYEYLIYRVEFDGELLFWKPSIDKFAKTRDGRFPIF